MADFDLELIKNEYLHNFTIEFNKLDPYNYDNIIWDEINNQFNL